MEGDGKLYHIEIKKTATPSSQLTRVFSVIDKAPLVRGAGAVLCTPLFFHLAGLRFFSAAGIIMLIYPENILTFFDSRHML